MGAGALGYKEAPQRALGHTAQGQSLQATYKHGSGKEVWQKAGLEHQGLSESSAFSCGTRGGPRQLRHLPWAHHSGHSP